MAERIKIGIIFSNNENWIGGTYYILNLLHALLRHCSRDQIELAIFYGTEKDKAFLASAGISVNSMLPIEVISLRKRSINDKLRRALGISIFNDKYNADIVDVVFPYGCQNSLSNIPQKIGWIPDFQEYYFPELYSKELLERRLHNWLSIITSCNRIVLSSKACDNDFVKHYPKYKDKSRVVRFAVFHPDVSNIDIQLLKDKYKLSKPFFISPNQFWAHKNHIVILKALLHYKQTYGDIPFNVVFTGKEYDHRTPEYTEMLKDFVIQNDLGQHVAFLGFIDRMDLLGLIKASICVIQPSKFEGWSTVIEDAKALSKFVIASDLDVNIEQISINCDFFPAESASQLSGLLHKHFNENLAITPFDYAASQSNFANEFIAAIS